MFDRFFLFRPNGWRAAQVYRSNGGSAKRENGAPGRRALPNKYTRKEKEGNQRAGGHIGPSLQREKRKNSTRRRRSVLLRSPPQPTSPAVPPSRGSFFASVGNYLPHRAAWAPRHQKARFPALEAQRNHQPPWSGSGKSGEIHPSTTRAFGRTRNLALLALP